MPRPRLSPHERRLDQIRSDHQVAKARLAEIGFTCEGSLVCRYTCCHNPNCRCADPAQRHGPYWQLSWKEQGRTVSRLISPDQAQLYQEWVANRRRLEAVLAEMRELSRQAGEHITAAAGQRFHGPTRPHRQRPAGG